MRQDILTTVLNTILIIINQFLQWNPLNSIWFFGWISYANNSYGFNMLR